MKAKVPLFVASMFASFSCAQVQTSNPQMIFQDSPRRDATGDEQWQVVRLEMGCTAFLIKNSKSDLLAITARHCMSYQINEWCDGNGHAGKGVLQNADQKLIGVCKEVLAASSNRDFAMFRFAWATTPEATEAESKLRPLRLALFTSKKFTRLKMIGFPADMTRQGKLSVTENCWTLDEVKLSREATWGQKNRDLAQSHNCSTWGGNSGGPMLIDGTDIVVSLPDAYTPDNPVPLPPSTLEKSFMIQTGDFLRQNLSQMKQYGVDMVALQPSETIRTSAPTKQPFEVIPIQTSAPTE